MHEDSAQAQVARDRASAVGRPVNARMRSVLSLASAVRVALARRMQMSVHDLQALEHIMTAEGTGPAADVGPSELARRLGVTTAATTQSLHRLEASGHVRRRPHPQDRRRQTVEVTEQGAQHVFASLAPLFGMLDEQIASLTPAEQRAALRFVEGQETAYRQFLAHLSATPAPEPPERGASPASGGGRGGS